MKKITIVAGARPNFMKIGPIIKEIIRINKKKPQINYSLVHTGQHYDKNMSKNFFHDLDIPEPDINLDCGGGNQSEITAKIMIAFHNYLKKNITNLVVVVGDVTSTMACSIVAKKMNIPVAHIEAGIRSGDMKMPEEINRIVTDSISDFFFTTTKNASKHLKECGVKKQSIFFVGNTMIDSLLQNISKFRKPEIWNKAELKSNNFLVITLHRPSNVDNESSLKLILDEIINNSRDFKLIFPMHPRTKKAFEKLNLSYKNLFITPPLSYLEFNFLVSNAKAVITDSGGITEETTILKIPCLTLRDSTERPETIFMGTNELVGSNPKNIKKYLEKLFENKWKKGVNPEKWDGKTSKRIVKKLIEITNE